MGYLVFLRNGADIFVETDDDSWPHVSFCYERKRIKKVRSLRSIGGVDTYSYFSS